MNKHLSLADITVEQLKAELSYCCITGKFYWRNRKGKGKTRFNGKIAGTLRQDGRRRITLNGKSYLASRLAWLYHFGYWPIMDLDHKNTITSDDRIDNLRLSTCSQNNSNTNNRSDNKSGFKGVTWHKRLGKWRVRIIVKGKYFHIGVFADLTEAANAYKLAAEKYFGEFARS